MMRDDTSRMLADQLDRLLADRVTPALIAASETGAGNGGLDAALADLGLDLALVPEAAGGAGLGWRDVGDSLQTLGYHAAPCDLGERMVANLMLSKMGHEAGAGAVAVALDPVSVSGASASGTVFVPWGAAGTPLVAADGAGGVVLLSTEGAAAQPLRTVGRVPTLLLTLQDAPVLARAETGAAGPVEMMAVVRAAQIAGALSRILELSIEYGNTREQFGRPIGKFQAVQHLIAALAGEAGCARAGVELGLAGLDAGQGWEPVAVAKIRASRAVSRGADVAQEAHGAIGITEEHMLHHFTRRLWQWREEAGDEHLWSERLGRALIARGADALWPSVVELAGG